MHGPARYETFTMTWNISPGSLSSPLIIAHRGDSSAAPENTLEAFRRAVEVGADGIELDVRLTRDREVVVIHDRLIDRTTTGTGPVGTHTLAELKEMDAGSWFDPRFKSARVPTLTEVFEELPASLLVNVEIKARGHGVLPLVSRVVENVRRCDRRETTLVASFHPVALGLARVMEPRIARGFIWSHRHPLPLRGRWLSPLASPQWMDPDRGTWSLHLVERFHRQGKLILAWDQDVGVDLTAMAETKTDGIVTDRPEFFVKQRR